MTIPPLPPGTQTFYGPNSQFLALGTVQTFIPRSTSLKTTWTVPTQASTNANPIVLSALGQAIVYGFGAYRQIVKSANGDTIWDSPTFGGAQDQTTVVLNTGDSGVWIVPTGVRRIYVEAVGGGGAGSNCLAPTAVFDVSGGGGGAGGFANGFYSVFPGEPLTYTVGAGGVGGDQGNGGVTSLGGFVTCDGGAGSNFSAQGTSVGGAGGPATGGNIMSVSGGSGTDGSHIPPSGGKSLVCPGLGGTSFYGQGGTGVNGANGNDGTAPGSGGGGAFDVNLTGLSFNGGSGAVGQIIITYWG